VETVDSTFDLVFPDGWNSIEAPEGAVAVIVAPAPENGFYANLVVTLTRPSAESPPATPAVVDRYLWEVVAGLTSALTEPSIEAVWTTNEDDHQPQQRLVVRHLVDGIAVQLIQHHTWVADGIVVISASMALTPESDPDFISMLDVCLLSAAEDKAAAFVDWMPSVIAAPWSPAPEADRIAHL
jgi:hypothetical protein